MSNDPNQAGDFGAQQFQKIQFGHKPHEEFNSDDVTQMIRDRIRKPAKILMVLALLTLLLLGAVGVWSCGSLALQRDDYVGTWNHNVLTEHREKRQASTRPNEKMSKRETKELKGHTDWNKNYFAIMIGFRAISFFFAMVFAAFIGVSAYKMTKLRGYKQSISASIMSLIPFISPLIVLGIPLGIWLLLILKDPNVRKAFN